MEEESVESVLEDGPDDVSGKETPHCGQEGGLRRGRDVGGPCEEGSSSDRAVLLACFNRDE
jgi:hypothetical protein